jgi:N-acetyl sugar amidotransferase
MPYNYILDKSKVTNLTTCTRCIFDSTTPKISFNAQGICNYCEQFEDMKNQYPIGEEGKKILEQHIAQLKKDGKGKPYDVVIGVSGGCDSTYMLHIANQYGLRVLAAHFDNTYNSKIAVENIQVVLEKLNIDLYTHVVDNDEFQRIYKSFILASVPNIDTPTDLALAVVHYMAAAKYGIKHIWEGHSFRTEGISPQGWFYMDGKYIQDIHNKFGDGKIKTLPVLWMGKWLKWMLVDKIKKHRPLYFIDYNKSAVKEFLAKEYGWQWYGGHHMENRTSYFTVNYYQPKKFNIDLRYSELSALVRSGQMDKKEAFNKLKEEKPFDPEVLDEVKKRLSFTDQQWEDIMNAPLNHYTDFKTYHKTFKFLKPVFTILLKAGYITRSFYDKYILNQ